MVTQGQKKSKGSMQSLNVGEQGSQKTQMENQVRELEGWAEYGVRKPAR